MTQEEIDKMKDRLEHLERWWNHTRAYHEHPGAQPESWRAYDRQPIQIHHGTVIMLQLFKGGSRLEDLWASDMTDLARHGHEGVYRNAARQFHAQLEGHDCVAFWQALRDEADKVITEWREACGKFDSAPPAAGGSE